MSKMAKSSVSAKDAFETSSQRSCDFAVTRSIVSTSWMRRWKQNVRRNPAGFFACSPGLACQKCSSLMRKSSPLSRSTIDKTAANCSRKLRLQKPSVAVISHSRWWWWPGSAPPGRRRWSSSIETSKSIPPAISNWYSVTYWSRGRRSTSAQKDSCFNGTGRRRIQPILQSLSAKSCFQVFGVKTFGRLIRRISIRWTTPSSPSWSKKSGEHDTLPSKWSRRLQIWGILCTTFYVFLCCKLSEMVYVPHVLREVHRHAIFFELYYSRQKVVRLS